MLSGVIIPSMTAFAQRGYGLEWRSIPPGTATKDRSFIHLKPNELEFRTVISRILQLLKDEDDLSKRLCSTHCARYYI